MRTLMAVSYGEAEQPSKLGEASASEAEPHSCCYMMYMFSL